MHIYKPCDLYIPVVQFVNMLLENFIGFHQQMCKLWGDGI